jgi:hypothetical protein
MAGRDPIEQVSAVVTSLQVELVREREDRRREKIQHAKEVAGLEEKMDIMATDVREIKLLLRTLVQDRSASSPASSHSASPSRKRLRMSDQSEQGSNSSTSSSSSSASSPSSEQEVPSPIAGPIVATSAVVRTMSTVLMASTQAVFQVTIAGLTLAKLLEDYSFRHMKDEATWSTDSSAKSKIKKVIKFLLSLMGAEDKLLFDSDSPPTSSSENSTWTMKIRERSNIYSDLAMAELEKEEAKYLPPKPGAKARKPSQKSFRRNMDPEPVTISTKLPTVTAVDKRLLELEKARVGKDAPKDAPKVVGTMLAFAVRKNEAEK